MRKRLHDLLDDALSDDPARALVAVRRLRGDELPWLEHRAVVRARVAGWSWARVGRLLARSRQAVQQRYDGAAPRVAPAEPLGIEEQWHREIAAMRRDLRHVDDDDPVAW